jgi:basic amino acid/polyamine antiporter, APA family
MIPVRKSLSVTDAVLMIVGIVIGAGLFKTPSIVAAQLGSEWMFLVVWALGGVVSLAGSLCYAELGSTYPHSGGDYHYLTRAFGRGPAFLFAWARMSVVQTGSIAMLAFLIGDYASEVFRLGDYSASHYAAAVIAALTYVNIAGIQPGKSLQKALMVANFIGLALLIGAGLALTPPVQDPVPPSQPTLPGGSSIGGAMIFVLLTYGGWNEAAFLSAEIRDPHRNMARTLIYSIALITAAYLLVNTAFLRGLGFSGVSASGAVAADLMRRFAGENGARFISVLIVLAVLSTINGIVVTGARTSYALGLDFRPFRFLGRWREQTGTPVNALLVQGAVSILLVFLGTGTRSGFVMMVEYTAPVFWLFFLLTGVSILVLRGKEPHTLRPFPVPLYPWTPILFCGVCAYMLHSSLMYTGKGALLGVGVLLAGLPLLFIRSS